MIFQLQRNDNKPIELWSNKVILQKINYVHQNPVEAGLVFRELLDCFVVSLCCTSRNDWDKVEHKCRRL